jgi:hypothetical protein
VVGHDPPWHEDALHNEPVTMSSDRQVLAVLLVRQ